MSDNRPIVYQEGDKTVWRASSLGQCKSALAWALLGTEPEPPPEFLHAAFAEGNAYEDVLIAKLVEECWLTEADTQLEKDDSGQYLLELAWGREIIRCHPDGVFMGSDGPVVVEVKYVGDALWDKLGRDIKEVPNYAWQASIEMAATGMPLLYGVGRKDPETRELIDFKSKLYLEPPYSLGQIKKRVAEVRAITRNDEMPDCEYAMFPCAYWPFHTETDPAWKKTVVTLSGDEAAILDDIMDAYLKAKKVGDAAEKDRKAASKEFAKFAKGLELKPGEQIATDNRTVTYVQQTRRSTDWKKLAADNDIDVKEYETTYQVTYPKEVAK